MFYYKNVPVFCKEIIFILFLLLNVSTFFVELVFCEELSSKQLDELIILMPQLGINLPQGSQEELREFVKLTIEVNSFSSDDMQSMNELFKKLDHLAVLAPQNKCLYLRMKINALKSREMYVKGISLYEELTKCDPNIFDKNPDLLLEYTVMLEKTEGKPMEQLWDDYRDVAKKATELSGKFSEGHPWFHAYIRDSFLASCLAENPNARQSMQNYLSTKFSPEMETAFRHDVEEIYKYCSHRGRLIARILKPGRPYYE